MFPLYTKKLPADAADLAVVLNESVNRIFSGVETPVKVRDKGYPHLAEIKIALDGAELRSDPPSPPSTKGKSSPALQVDKLHLKAAGITLGPAVADLRLEARDVLLHQAKDKAGEIVLVLQSAADGEIEINADKSVLEDAIATVAKAEAGKHGVAIDQVQLSVTSRSARSVDAEVQVRAKKLFFSTIIRIAAKLDLDEELNATLSGVTCDGEGAIGSMACGFLSPHLEKVNGRTFPLMALPLGEVKLRDVRMEAGKRLTVSAEFGT